MSSLLVECLWIMVWMMVWVLVWVLGSGCVCSCFVVLMLVVMWWGYRRLVMMVVVFWVMFLVVVSRVSGLCVVRLCRCLMVVVSMLVVSSLW